MRLLPVYFVAILVLISASPLSAQKPTRIPIGDLSGHTFEAGLVCSFPLRSQPLVNEAVATIFPPEENGDQRVILTGHLIVEYTNLDTGKSKVYNLSGPGILQVHPDGSVTFELLGRSSVDILPTDIPPGPLFLVNSGKLVFELTPSGQLILLSQTGHVQDVCAELS
jgi:hypothetical protein